MSLRPLASRLVPATGTLGHLLALLGAVDPLEGSVAVVAGAAADAGVDGAILARLEGAPDHPTTLVFPEGEYLKGLAIVKAQ